MFLRAFVWRNTLRFAACLFAFSIATPNFSSAATPAISAHDSHALILKKDGTLWIVGDKGATTPVEQPSFPGAVAISTNAGANYVLKDDGTLWSWGNNQNGQLGIGTTESTDVPRQVLGLPRITQIRCQTNLRLTVFIGYERSAHAASFC